MTDEGLVRGFTGSIIHRPTCRYAKNGARWRWADRHVIGWDGLRVRVIPGTYGGERWAAEQLRACLVCRPHLDRSGA